MYRDNGNGYGDLVINQIQESDLAGKPQANGLIATDFPGGSLGKSFTFVVSVVTAYTPTTGISGPVSDPFLLAGVPSQPMGPPTRDPTTSNT